MASSSKRRRVDEEPGNFFDVSGLKENVSQDLLSQLDTLCLFPHKKAVTLRPLKILNCNAADERGVPFSKAYCSIETPSETFLFGDIFRHGLKLIVDFITDPERKLPIHKHDKHVLCKLLHFINTDAEETFEDIDILTETELTTLLANHLLGKLTLSCDYIIDKNSSGKKGEDTCHCGKQNCRLTGSYGDTSIGNYEVWHGNMDIVLNNDVGVVQMEDKVDSQGGKSPVKLKSANISRNSLTAETIVFSFLQKKRHPANSHFLTPCIGVGRSEMVIMLYDSDHDVLLESSCIPLMENMDGGVSKLSLGVIIVSWLVVNYKYLCGGLTESMKSYMKAEFFNQAEKKISIYENNLKFQNVGSSTSRAENSSNVQVDRILSSDFTYELHMEIGNYLYNKRN